VDVLPPRHLSGATCWTAVHYSAVAYARQRDGAPVGLLGPEVEASCPCIVGSVFPKTVDQRKCQFFFLHWNSQVGRSCTSFFFVPPEFAVGVRPLIPFSLCFM